MVGAWQRHSITIAGRMDVGLPVDALLLLPFSGAQPIWRDLLLALSRSKMTLIEPRAALV
jgi:hypothetical protein